MMMFPLIVAGAVTFALKMINDLSNFLKNYLCVYLYRTVEYWHNRNVCEFHILAICKCSLAGTFHDISMRYKFLANKLHSNYGEVANVLWCANLLLYMVERLYNIR